MCFLIPPILILAPQSGHDSFRLASPITTGLLGWVVAAGRLVAESVGVASRLFAADAGARRRLCARIMCRSRRSTLTVALQNEQTSYLRSDFSELGRTGLMVAVAS